MMIQMYQWYDAVIHNVSEKVWLKEGLLFIHTTITQNARFIINFISVW